MKKFLFLTLILIPCLCACTAAQPDGSDVEPSDGPTWQEQYDLGVRYLSEGNYYEAIIAFTAAIEIDPKQAPAYVGRGDAYMLSGETEQNLAEAKADYEMAIELDEANAGAYLGLADVHIRQENYEDAFEILRQALEIFEDNQQIIDKINEKREMILSKDNFFSSGSFTEFDGLNPVIQNLLKKLINAVDEDEYSVAEILVKEYVPLVNGDVSNGQLGDSIYTLFKGFKIRLFYYFDGTAVNTKFEIRQKTGMAYYCSSSPRVVTITRGETQQWNWNGSFERLSSEDISSYSDSPSITVRTSGNCVNGLIDGTLHGDVEVQGEEGYSYSYYRTYNMGKGSKHGTYEDGRPLEFSLPDEPYIYETCFYTWISDPENFYGKW